MRLGAHAGSGPTYQLLTRDGRPKTAGGGKEGERTPPLGGGGAEISLKTNETNRPLCVQAEGAPSASKPAACPHRGRQTLTATASPAARAGGDLCGVVERRRDPKTVGPTDSARIETRPRPPFRGENIAPRCKHRVTVFPPRNGEPWAKFGRNIYTRYGSRARREVTAASPADRYTPLPSPTARGRRPDGLR